MTARTAVLKVLEGGGEVDAARGRLGVSGVHGEAADVPLVVKLASPSRRRWRRPLAASCSGWASRA